MPGSTLNLSLLVLTFVVFLTTALNHWLGWRQIRLDDDRHAASHYLFQPAVFGVHLVEILMLVIAVSVTVSCRMLFDELDASLRIFIILMAMMAMMTESLSAFHRHTCLKASIARGATITVPAWTVVLKFMPFGALYVLLFALTVLLKLLRFGVVWQASCFIIILVYHALFNGVCIHKFVGMMLADLGAMVQRQGSLSLFYP